MEGSQKGYVQFSKMLVIQEGGNKGQQDLLADGHGFGKDISGQREEERHSRPLHS